MSELADAVKRNINGSMQCFYVPKGCREAVTLYVLRFKIHSSNGIKGGRL